MSEIYKHENQMIIRFPKDVAAKIRQAFADNKEIPIKITPKKGEIFKFDVEVQDNNLQGTLVDLPTITESYKSRDNINLYKSNDINQMIWVGEMKNVRKVQIDEFQSKYVCDSGLTPPTYNVSKDFHRKQPLIPIDQIQRVEKELETIQNMFMNQDDDREDGENRRRQKGAQQNQMSQFD